MQFPHSPHDNKLGARIAFCGALLALLSSVGCSKSSAAATGDAPKDKPAAAMPERATDPTGPVITPPGLTKSTLKASDYPTAKVATTGQAVTDDSVTVGILHSTTGTMAISETGSVQAE